MGKKARPAGDIARPCRYCGFMSRCPKDPKYSWSGDSGVNARYSHHPRVVRLDGIEILPACQLGKGVQPPRWVRRHVASRAPRRQPAE